MRGGLVAALLALLAAAHVQAEPADAVAIPLPAVGDAGLYTLVTVSPAQAKAPLPKGAELTRFAWLPDAVLRDAEGRPVAVNDLHERVAGGDEAIRHYGAEDGRLVAATRLVQEGGDVALARRVRDYDHAAPAPRATDLDQGFCGVREPLVQGRTLPLDRPVQLFSGNCRLETGDWEPGLAETDFAFERRLDVGGVPVLVFRQAEDPRVRVWLSPDVPYPLLIAYPRRDASGAADGDALRVVRLEGFARGSTPLGVAQASGERVEVGLAAWTPWGPDDAAVAHPFPLSRAFALARDDPADASLRDFLNATREPYVRSAAYSETLSPGWTLRQWTFSVAGDGRTLDATVLQRIRDDPGGPGGPLDPLGGRDPLRPSGGGSATVESSYGAGAPFPVARGDLPRELPSLPDALRAWRAYRDDALGDAAPNAWGFAHAATCDETGACGYGGTRLEAGLARVDHAQPLQRRSLLALDADGRVVSLDESTMARGPAPPSPAPFVMGGADVVLHPPLREWPLATLWAAGGLLALGAAGAAAWLAATGRLALLPLFSRIERERAADHALRARLLAQVRAEPGLDVAALAARNGVAWSTAMHHVRKLEALGAARTARVAGRRCVYPSAARLTPESLSLPLLRRDATRRVLLAVSERPGALQRDVARRLGLDESTVSHHCRRLEAAGLLEGRASGNQRALYLTPVAQELLTASG